MNRRLVLCMCAALAGPAPALAATAWEDISGQLYGIRALTPAGDHIALDVPYRTENDARTVLGARIEGPGGRLIDKVTVVLDENPMPVSAVLDFARPLPRVMFEMTLRINGPTPLHVVAETTDGQLYVAEGFVKTSGQGACAAPPGTNPEDALASLGEMTIDLVPLSQGADLAARLGAQSQEMARMDIDISHPSLSGLQRDQVTLLFIPMRYVEKLQVELDGEAYVDITGSISLAENPRVGLSAPADTREAEVTMTDTDGTVTRAKRRFSGY